MRRRELRDSDDLPQGCAEMKYFVKISIEGSFSSGVDNEGTYEIPERLHNRFMSDLTHGIYAGVVKKV